MKTLTDAASISMPKIRNRHSGKRNAYWWTPEIAEARKKCISARRILKRKKASGSLEAITVVSERLKRARIELNNLILASKRNTWMELIKSIEANPWRKPYKIVMEKFRTSTAPVSETLSKDFLTSVLRYLFPEKTNRYRMIATDVDGDIDDISDSEMKHTINRMKTGIGPWPIWAPGPDGITAEMIKKTYNTIQSMLKNTLTKCLREGLFPRIWKEGRLVLIRKPAKPEDLPSSYRPICVLSEVGKILERIIALRIEIHLNEVGPNISEDQFGFRKNRSTVDAILEYKSRIREIINQNWCAVAISLDISNAFNTLPWDVINEEMEAKNFPRYLRAIVFSYLQDRAISYISSEGVIVREKITCGVPQGSVLGPVLWNIAYDRILSRGAYHGCSLLCYADDTLLIARGKNVEEVIRKAEIGTNILINRIEEMGLKVAVEKTEVVVFLPGKKKE